MTKVDTRPRLPASYRTDSRGVVRILDATRYVNAHPDADVCRCGSCGRTWDDAVPTALTPAPSARCPYEDRHKVAGGAR